VKLTPGTRAAEIYQVDQALKPFYCSYGINPQYRERLVASGLVISGEGEDGEPRVLELPSHPFFFATLFVPMARSAPGEPHPLVRELARAAARRSAA
jgi:CTP synthase (UTP-ammonia lyase)